LVPQLDFTMQAPPAPNGARLWASCSFDSTGTMLAAANSNGNLYLVNIINKGAAELKQVVPPLIGQMVACDFAPKMPLIASVENDPDPAVTNSLLEFWDASNQTLSFSKTILCDRVLFSPSGQLIAVVRNNVGRPDIPTIWGLP
jgi:hypothetical protein